MRKDSAEQETTSECLRKLASTLQAVHAEEKHEMASICEEKLQLSECLERMSTEIINLNSVANKDKQENPQLAFEDGVALENMLDEIERGHRRAEELESKIEKLQQKLEKESAIEVNNTVDMQKAWQELHRTRLQLSEKTNEIESYTQALRIETGKLQKMSDDPEENYSNTVGIAEKMRERLAKCDKEFCFLESDCKSRELELDEVQRELEATDTRNLSEALGTRDAHIKELEKKLFAKEREVQATQQKLQNLEVAIDANESRARQLELDLKVMTTTLWQITESSPLRILSQVYGPASQQPRMGSEFNAAQKDKRKLIRLITSCTLNLNNIPLSNCDGSQEFMQQTHRVSQIQI